MPFNFKKSSAAFFCCLFIPILAAASNDYALDKKSSLALTHYIMGNIYNRQGDDDLAHQEYLKAIELEKDNPNIHLNLARNYINGQETDKAIEELNLACQLDAEAVEPHAVLAVIYYSQDKNAEGDRELEIALRNATIRDPENIAVYKTLGAVYLQQKRFASAENTYINILKISPNDFESHFLLGSVYYELKNKDKSIQALKKALSLKPDYHQALNYLGYLYAQESKNLEEAESMIKKAIALDPDNGAYVDSLGWVYFKKGKIKEAIRQLERAAKLLEDPVIFDHLGDVYFKTKNFKNAKLNWRKSLQLDPAQEIIKGKLEKLK
jgi:tetratricopeptide (TPR) repeat protein